MILEYVRPVVSSLSGLVTMIAGILAQKTAMYLKLPKSSGIDGVFVTCFCKRKRMQQRHLSCSITGTSRSRDSEDCNCACANL